MAKDSTSITSIDDEPAVVLSKKAEHVAVTDHGDNMSGERYEVTIQAGEGDAGKQAVFLAINGHGLNIPRGVPVNVPAEVVEILDNATMTIYEAAAGGKMVEREVKRFSYSAKPAKATKK